MSPPAGSTAVKGGDTPERGSTTDGTSLGVPGFDALITVVFALAGFGFGLQRLFDNSFLWHLRTGELILDTGGIPRVDPYSYTAEGTGWVVQSWLAEVVYAGLDRAFGPIGIRLLGAVAGALLMVLLFRLALRLARETWRAAGLTLVAVFAIRQLWTVRPLAFGLLAFAVLVWVVEIRGSWVRRHVLVVLPVLFWLWVNVHGSFALGFLYLALHFVGTWLDGERPWEGAQRRLLEASAISAVVIFLTPLGYKLVLFPMRVMERSDIFRNVVEWASPNFRESTGLFFALWLAVLVVVLARGRNRITRRDLIVALPFLLLALWARRNIAVVPLVTLPIAARAVAVQVPARRSSLSPLAGWGFAAVLGAAFVALTLSAVAEDDYDLDIYPVDAVSFLDDEALTGSRIYTTDVWSGYLIARSWPDQQVFMDDRFDMYPRDVYDDYVEVIHVGEDWSEVLDRRDVDVVMVPVGEPLNQVLDESPAWTRVFDDDTAKVYERDKAADR